MRVIPGDLANPKYNWACLDGHTALIHNAIVWDEEPTELELHDVRASVRLFEAAGKAIISHVIYTSSTAVHRPFSSLMTEQTALQTADLYGATKAATELYLFSLATQHGFRANVIRLGPVVGPSDVLGGPFKSDRTMFKMARAAVAGHKISVVQGSARQFVSVNQAAEFYRKVLESPSESKVHLCVSHRATAWEDIAKSIVRQAKSSSKVTLTGSEEYTRFDPSKAESEFGINFDSDAAMQEHIQQLVEQCQKESLSTVTDG